MKRRNFVKSLTALPTLGFAGYASGGIFKDALKCEAKFDVVVVGGGTAGTIAALQAARLGAKTLVVERASQLGGTMTTAGVNFPGLFHINEKQIIAGIGWELVCKAVAENSDSLPEFKKQKRHWQNQIRVNDYLYACLAEEELIKARAEILYYSYPEKIEETENGYRLYLSSSFGRGCIFAKKIIDCTANASAAALAGYKRVCETRRSPGTLVFRIGNFNIKDVDLKAVRKNYNEAVAQGKLGKKDIWTSIEHLITGRGENCLYVKDADNSTPLAFSKSNILGRKILLGIFRFLKTQKGLENVKMEMIKTEVGVRETYKVVGEEVMSIDEDASGRLFADSLCYSFYPIDLHDVNGLKTVHLKEGVFPAIPLSILTPKGAKNMLVAGRCASADRFANSAMRVQASCMAMGQVAGCVSALAALKNIDNRKLDLLEVRKTLKAHNAIVPPQV